MAVYEVELEDGSIYEIETEETKLKTSVEPQNILGQVFNTPGAAIRSAILGQGFRKGATQPSQVPTFQDLAMGAFNKNMPPPRNPLEYGAQFAGGMGAGALGMGADVLTNPANLLAMLVGKAPIGGGKTLGQVATQTKPAQAIGRFFNMPIQETGLAKTVTKTVQAPINFVKNVTRNIKNVKNPVRFSQTVRKTFFDVKRQVGDEFEKGIAMLSKAHPEKKIDLSAEVQYLKDAIDDTVNNPGLGSQIKSTIRSIRNPEKAKIIQGMIENPMNAQDLTLVQAQEIKNMIQQAPAIATKLKQGKFADWKPGDLELLDLIDDIKLAQSEVFPEMAQVRQPYAEFMTNYKNVKNMFKPGRLIEKMKTGFGDEEIQAMVKAILPQDTMKAIKGFRRTIKGLKVSGALAGFATVEEAVRRGINANRR